MAKKLEDIKKYLIVQGEPYLKYNEVERKWQVAMIENIFRWKDDAGEEFKDCYTNEVILDYDADDKTVFEYKLKGNIEPDYPENPE
jgi:hypothetical protein